jgi:hypothetical protein
MNIEARLTDAIGIAGKKLHTGRSRNDQVATDVRLYLRDEIDNIRCELTRLQRGMVQLAVREHATIMPVLHICKQRSRLRLVIMCWHGMKCWSVITAAWLIARNA